MFQLSKLRCRFEQERACQRVLSACGHGAVIEASIPPSYKQPPATTEHPNDISSTLILDNSSDDSTIKSPLKAKTIKLQKFAGIFVPADSPRERFESEICQESSQLPDSLFDLDSPTRIKGNEKKEPHFDFDFLSHVDLSNVKDEEQLPEDNSQNLQEVDFLPVLVEKAMPFTKDHFYCQFNKLISC